MMIHPSHLISKHTDYFIYVKSIISRWTKILEIQDEFDLDKKELLAEFRQAHSDVKRTAPDLPEFEILEEEYRLLHIIRNTDIQSLNTDKGNETSVHWLHSYANILIGGNALDRGFTVEGLTVTYMPRSIGGGLADTIQQRARFMGYKSSYIGYCRIYLGEEAFNSYKKYVIHEEDLRQRLLEHNNSEASLNEWIREVKLDPSLNPSRRNIFSKEFIRHITRNEWMEIRSPHHAAIHQNQAIIIDFLLRHSLINDNYINISLPNFYEEVLTGLEYLDESDKSKLRSLQLSVKDLLNSNPIEQCSVFLFGSFEKPRRRSIDKNKIVQLFQGSNSKDDGDRSKINTGITFQIHILDLLQSDQIVYEKVPVLAAYINAQTIGAVLNEVVIAWKD